MSDTVVTGGLLGPALKALRWTATHALPERWRQQATARIAEHNPFDVIADRRDLTRALRLAWVRVAMTVLWRAGWSTAANPAEALRFRREAIRALRQIRFDALDRRASAETTPIDRYLPDLWRHLPETAPTDATPIAPHPLTAGFAATLAAIVGWEVDEVPNLVTGTAVRGVRTFKTAEPRDFAALVLADFGDLLADPKRFPKAGPAFQIDMMHAARVLGEATLTAVRDLDARVTERLTALSDTLRANIRTAVHDTSRKWLGVPDYGGAVDPTSAGARRDIAARPTALLIASYRVVPFLDRDGILAEAMAWATSTDDLTFPGRLYVAPGGFGKTRLALELAEKLRDRGWRCRFLSSRNTARLVPGSLPDLLRDEDARGVLLVFDYAEAQTTLLKEAAVAVDATKSTVPIRLLALARSPEGWWDGLSREDAMARVFDPAPHQNIQAPLSPEDRSTLLGMATKAFSDALTQANEPPPDGGSKNFDMAGRDLDRPVMVAMAAFLGARGIGADPKASILAQVFQQEHALWKRTIGRDVRDDDTSLALLARAATQITLVQGATAEGAALLLASDRKGQAYGAAARDAALGGLARLYGVGVPSTIFLRAIEPDILGEHAAMFVLARDHDGLLDATMRTALAGTPLYPWSARQILTVLVRAMREEHDTPLHRGDPTTTRQVAEVAIGRIAALVATLPRDKLLRLDAALPHFSLPLINLSLGVAQRVTDTANDPAARASSLNTLVIRLRDTGDRDRALQAAQRAVTIYEVLERDNPADFGAGLGGSLNNLANCLAETGDINGALQPAQHAADIFERLARENPGVHRGDLAMSLHSLARILGATGDHGGALELARRAVDIREQQANADPAAFLADLAASLDSYGMRLSGVGTYDEALLVTRRAVEIYEQLARSHPAAYFPHLGGSLNNLANRIAEIGDRIGALDPAKRAVAIHERLARASPMTYLPDLAASLNTLAIRLSETSDHHAALEQAQRAVEVYELLVKTNPGAYRPALAASLDNLASFRSYTGERNGALQPIRRAVEIFEALTSENMSAYFPSLAACLNNFANRLTQANDHSGALEPAKRSVRMREQLARTNPAAHLSDLATSLGTLGDVTSAAGDWTTAIVAYTDSLTAFRTCFGSLPQRYGPYLVLIAGRLRDALRHAGREQEIEVILTAILGEELRQATTQALAAGTASKATMNALRMLEGFVAAFNDAVSARDAAKEAAALEQAAGLDRHLAEHAGDASLGALVAAWAGIKQQIAQGSAEGDGASDAG